MLTHKSLAKLAIAGFDGHTWYADAAIEIVAAARQLHCEPQRLADLLALFSPRVSVLRSIRFAIRYVKTGEFENDVMRTVRAGILHYEKTGEIRGNKTEPFSRAIMGDGSAIVLDVWMAKAIGCDQKLFKNKKLYAAIAGRVRRAATIAGLSPAECQASIWTTVVRQSGRNPGRLRIMRELNKSTNLTLFNLE